MRVSYSAEKRLVFFSALKLASGMKWGALAKHASVSARTLSAWRNGPSSIPMDTLRMYTGRFGVDMPEPDGMFSISEIKSRSGKIGGRVRIDLHGNPGTVAGRRLGALRAGKTHQKNPDSPFVARKVIFPSLSVKLAEFIGMLLGDGCISNRQISITLHKKDDRAYAEYAAYLMADLFKIPVEIRDRVSENVILLLISRTEIVRWLSGMNLYPGSKVKRQVGVPQWIRSSRAYKKACVRGLFDTDGSLYVDRHKIGNTVYLNGGMMFSNHSLPLLAFFKGSLEELGFHPTERKGFSIFLRRAQEVEKYFAEIGSSNPKHLTRFERFFSLKH